MKRLSGYSKQIVVFAVAAVVGGRVTAAERLRCPAVAEERRPALVFVEGPVNQSNLYVAWLEGGALRREKIISARYIEVTQLDNVLFLLSVADGNTDRRVYAADLGAGVLKFVADGTRTHCIRSEPGRRAALLMDANLGAGLIRLLELDFAGLNVTERHRLSSDLLGDDFKFFGPKVRISPDFTRIAYVHKRGPLKVERRSGYELRLLDLATMEVQTLDPNVAVEISMLSSFSCGRPPFEWINEKEVIYCSAAPAGPAEVVGFDANRVSIFKVADTESGQSKELFRKSLRLTLDGGSLRIDPLTGRLIYNGRLVLDLQRVLLTPKNLPFAVVCDYPSRTTDILCGQRVLYTGAAHCVGQLASASGRSFAYALRERGPSLHATLYAKFASRDEPLKVAEGPYLPTRAIGWIE
ncbi:MAG: hypothetical protein JSU94_10630 [Phycisphaerales bacterium]|nr:MAG: hypothetical protein JSU94_10630 [Phycisphaerales bacterium]